MDQIKNFLEQNKMRRFNRLSVDRGNKTISFGFVSKEVTISKSDISAASKKRYNIDYYSSILECLHKDIEFGKINKRQHFTADQFYEKLLSYNKRFDYLVSVKLTAGTAKDQKVDKSTKVQKTSIEYNTLPDYTQSDNLSISLSTKRSNFSVIGTTKYQEIDRFTNAQVTSTGYILPNRTNGDNLLTNSSTGSLMPCASNSNEQQSTALLVAATLIPGALILLAFILVYCYCKKRNSNEVGTNVGNVKLTLLNNESKQNSV